ncbi:ATP synthase complex assembly protein ATP12 [Aspergillus alliaceus]|uniref:ATP synthase complex assembly protein ATP12 n=1 Tax=Petromyces alliaceus TaxID=209559 RepID=UPI0012A47259|nr:uncharacterized protein BDW43DRAFT_316198 [Aspergillus alliaceus]KAB8228098.1 hypothetical protein BDW43DRAFT_316198 [Aspergillus alliaceus]
MPLFSRAPAALSRRGVSIILRHDIAIVRPFHSFPPRAAIAHPVTAHGPPPKAPSAAPEFGEHTGQQDGRIESSLDSKAPQNRTAKPSPPKKRFWKNVDVNMKPEGDYQVLLDTRPVRTPTKDVLYIPPTKPHLAHLIALEWDVMTSAQQALKSHMIPLTSLAARAAEIVREDANGETIIREQVVKTAMRYLETDTLLCWVPAKDVYGVEEVNEDGQRPESLREAQIRVAKDIISFLSTKLWPGIEIKPILDTESILPMSQTQATKDIIEQWIVGLQAHDLAALERGVLASKSLLVAVRLVSEWSENFRHAQRPDRKKFGIEEAAEASSLEVKWQTDMWGEVEDTHDVDKEDLKRQLGSVIVLVSGETR